MKAMLLMDFRRAAEFCQMDRRLRLILEDLAMVWPAQFMAITSIYRSPEEEDEIERRTGQKTSRIHTMGPPFRAFDLRTGEWGKLEIQAAVDKVNHGWVYDPERPDLQVLVYKPHGTGPHVHGQVHPHTRRREDA